MHQKQRLVINLAFARVSAGGACERASLGGTWNEHQMSIVGLGTLEFHGERQACAAEDRGNAFPSINRIAAQARVNKRTTMRTIVRLEAAGELLVKRPESYGQGHHNYYVVLMGRDPAEVAAVLGWPAPPTQSAPVSTDSASDSRASSDPIEDESKGDTLSPFEERAGQTAFSRGSREKGDSLAPLSEGKGAERRAQVSPNPQTPPLLETNSLVTTYNAAVENPELSHDGSDPSELDRLTPLERKALEITNRHRRDATATADAELPPEVDREPALASG